MVERPEVRIGRTKGGELITEFRDEEGKPFGVVVGEGENVRGAVSMGEIFPGRTLVESWGVSEKATEKILEEMEAIGGQRIEIGSDSPDLGRSQHGWTRKFGDNYPRIFGHD